MAREKKRLDLLLQERYPQYSRQQLQSWIMQGNVTIAGTVVTKAGHSVAVDADIVLAVQEPKFVGRAGFKL
ncbi:TlyA family rRNA (cytidine-2'-O)-methyltransferase, partial [Candidatus Dependentiae bacterium HGW-Dependentiae-1]